MRALFLLPDIQNVPTGGNVYNTKIIEALAGRIEISTLVLDPAGVLREEDVHGFDLVIVDSLLADSPGVTTIDKGRARWILMVHYLPACDPTSGLRHDRDITNALSFYDGFIATSAFTKACLVDLGVAAGRIVVIYPGLDEIFRKSGIESDRKRGAFRMLTVSNLLPGKGLVEFVDVLERLPEQNWQWGVVGGDTLDAEYAARFKSRITASPAASRMRWLGAVLPKRMPALYRSYDLFVLPSRFETLGMALREAMACGLPVVAYDVGGISENLVDGGGILIAPFEGQLMGKKIDEVMGNPEQRDRMARDARQAGLAFPSWEESGKSLLERFSFTHFN